jgi:hypothetical protein
MALMLESLGAYDPRILSIKGNRCWHMGCDISGGWSGHDIDD